MFWIEIVFPLLVAIFGLHVFTAMRVLLRVCILGLITLFVAARFLLAPKPAVDVVETPAPAVVKWGFMTADALKEASPTPTATPEVELYDYPLDN
jgi:hypothetical protein